MKGMNLLSRLKTIKGPYRFFLLQTILLSTGFGFVPLFFRTHGYPLHFLVLLFALVSAISLFMPFFLSVIRVRLFLGIGMVIFSAMAFTLALSHSSVSFFIYVFLLGLTVAFYWIPINYLFFSQSKKKTNAVDSSLYFVTMSVIGMIFPAIGAVIITYGGFKGLFTVIGILQIVLLFYVMKNMPPQRFPSHFKEALAKYKGLRLITLIDGSIEYFIVAVLPIYALLFLKTELEFGGFLVYLGVLGVVVTLFLASHSDRKQRRLRYVTPLLWTMSVLIVIMGFIDHLAWWLAVTGMYTVVAAISKPLRLAILMDTKKMEVGFWRVREVFLHSGRFITLSLSMLFFWYSQFTAVFIMYGILIFIYPFVIRYTLKVTEVNE